tara:strand:- start:1584 stop:2048 length:465 start_codon:yes stop_codon:yes gene_type:complete
MARGTGERGPQISADDLARAWAVYQEKGTYQAAADAIGRSESPVRRALLRRYTGERSAKVDPYARALNEVAGDLAETHRLTARRLRQALRVADDTTLPDIVAQINDTVRALTSTRVAHAKLTGDHAPDKHAVTVDAVDEISRRIARLAESDEAG